MELARSFLAGASWASGTPELLLEQWLAATLLRASAGLELAVSGHDFARFLGERLTPTGNVEAALGAGHARELYLAFGCLARCEPALKELEAQFFSKLRVRGSSSEHRGEVLQQLRSRLLVAAPGETPKLAQYRGEGPLLAWLQLSATRLSIELSRKEPRAELRQRAFSDLDLVVDPELDFLKLRYVGHFQRALDRALAQLSDSDAALLKLCYLNQTPPSALAKVYGVSPRTVQRRVAELRERILELTRGYLQSDLSLESGELDSLMALVQSRLQLSLRRLGGASPLSTPPSD